MTDNSRSNVRRRLPSFVDDLFLASNGIQIGIVARRKVKIEAHFINVAAASRDHAAAAVSEVTSKSAADRLPLYRKLAYGVGHVFNDMSACVWFSYVLTFFQFIANLDHKSAGELILIGQIADAAAASIVGFLCDKTRTKYGRRKTWHLIGTILAAISLFFFWHTCLPCTPSTPVKLKILYFSIPICINVFGWTCVQISHLSLIPELTDDDSERVELTALR